MLAPGDQQGIDQALAPDQWPAGPLQFGIEEAVIEAGIVSDQRRIAEEGDQIVGDLGEEQLVLEELVAEAVYRKSFRRHAAFWIEIAVESSPDGMRLTSSMQPISTMRWP